MDTLPLENRVLIRQLRVRKDPGHRRCLQPTHSRPRRGSLVAPVSDPSPLRMVKLFLLGPMVREMEMTLENVSIANSGVGSHCSKLSQSSIFSGWRTFFWERERRFCWKGEGGYEKGSEQGWGGYVLGFSKRGQGWQEWKMWWESVLGEPLGL